MISFSWLDRPSELALLFLEVYRSHSDTLQSIGLHWTAIGPVQRPLTTHNTHNRHESMPPEGFETVIPANELLQIHALDRETTAMAKIDDYIVL